MTQQQQPHQLEDPYLWLEEVDAARAQDWVQRQNMVCEAELAGPEFDQLTADLLKVLESTDKIAVPHRQGDWIYNFWRDAAHPRGLWRRSPFNAYCAGEPEWQTLIDVDELSAAEGVDWVWHGADFCVPQAQRALIYLSPDGGDAHECREYDLTQCQWVDAAEGGFRFPTAKASYNWAGQEVVLAAIPSTDADTTSSTYPATVRLVRRGEDWQQAPVVFEVDREHLSVSARYSARPNAELVLVTDVVDFFTAEYYLHAGPVGENGVHLRKLPLPDYVTVAVANPFLLITTRKDWEYAPGSLAPAGSLLIADAAALAAGESHPQLVFTPDERTALRGAQLVGNHLLVSVLSDVHSTFLLYRINRDSDRHNPSVQILPLEFDTDELSGTDPFQIFSAWRQDLYGPDPHALWVSTTGFLTPPTLYTGRIVDSGDQSARLHLEKVSAEPSFFPGADYQVEQFFVRSADGTEIPYFLLTHRKAARDGANPTLLTGYGGFLLASTPGYQPGIGVGWLTRQDSQGRYGAYALANIRGGGEYGPAWHEAARQQNRHRAYEDFAAVAEDLQRRGVCTKEKLAAAGGSNGGLLMGNMLTQYPQLFAALSCGVPLLDMRRYTKLSAGTSWIAEYGDPEDPEQWKFLRTFSPYHLVDELSDEQLQQLPPTLFWTATSDDRVGPVHARKMAAKLLDRNAHQMRFHETQDGGHAGAGDYRSAAELMARWQLFLFRQLDR